MSNSKISVLQMTLVEKDAKIAEAVKELEELKKQEEKYNNSNLAKRSSVSLSFSTSKDNSNFNMDELRKSLISTSLEVNKKLELYNAACKGNLQEMSILASKKYNILEEISASKYYWTPIHYAMHYGHSDVIHSF